MLILHLLIVPTFLIPGAIYKHVETLISNELHIKIAQCNICTALGLELFGILYRTETSPKAVN